MTTRHMILDKQNNSWFDTHDTKDGKRIYTDGVERLTELEIIAKYGIPGRQSLLINSGVVDKHSNNITKG